MATEQTSGDRSAASTWVDLRGGRGYYKTTRRIEAHVCTDQCGWDWCQEYRHWDCYDPIYPMLGSNCTLIVNYEEN